MIGHSLVGADADYQQRFFNDLPRTFNPDRYDPTAWASLAKLCGFRYAAFTTKHHSGFCMFPTKTTDFSIENTPYKKDITRMYADAFRTAGLGVGFYFSPDDFWLLHKQGKPISRNRPEASPRNNPELMQHNLAQIRELYTSYGPVEYLFIDGAPDGIRELAWQLQPDTLVTRGAMKTPEQRLPENGLEDPWEACFTIGTAWQFQPTRETYKSGTQLIEMLIETRAKGGNLLLNVGPESSGVIPFEQERIIRELGLWLFINHEAIYQVRPWESSPTVGNYPREKRLVHPPQGRPKNRLCIPHPARGMAARQATRVSAQIDQSHRRDHHQSSRSRRQGTRIRAQG